MCKLHDKDIQGLIDIEDQNWEYLHLPTRWSNGNAVQDRNKNQDEAPQTSVADLYNV